MPVGAVLGGIGAVSIYQFNQPDADSLWLVPSILGGVFGGGLGIAGYVLERFNRPQPK